MAEDSSAPQVAEQPQVTAATDTSDSTPVKVSFGLSAFSLPTPESARQGFKFYLLVSSIIVLVVNGFPQIPVESKNFILQIVTVSNLVANRIEDFFGVKLS
jgi:hypothetical protein